MQDVGGGGRGRRGGKGREGGWEGGREGGRVVIMQTLKVWAGRWREERSD